METFSYFCSVEINLNYSFMQKKLFFLVSLLLTISLTAMAQVTTSGISGKVTSNGEEIIGATIVASMSLREASIVLLQTSMDVTLCRVCVLEVLTRWKSRI